MSHTLIQIAGNRFFNKTIWPPFLFVYDDMLVYKKRSWFITKEMTITYNQITQVNMYSGIFFAKLEIITPSNDEHIIIVNFVPKQEAVRAKRIIDQKVHTAHKDTSNINRDKSDSREGDIKHFEKSLTRIKELLNRGRITKREYEKQRKELLKKW